MRFQTILCLFLIAVIGGVLFVAALGMANAFPQQDLAGYWVAAHLASQNPYSLPLVAEFERSIGNFNTVPPLVRNPPWAIVLVLPLALFSYQTAFALWAVLSIVVVAGCARVAWNLSNPAPSLAPAFLSLFFGPTLCLLMLGQVTVLVLLGFTLFLAMVERRRDWLAGASLLLIVLKPHIALFFLLAVVLWTIQRKRWAILVSGALALAATCITAFRINPHIFRQYLDLAKQFPNETEIYPNLGGILYAATGHHGWAILPELIGTVWLAFYWRRHRADWDWQTDGVLALLISVVCSYHSFPYDEILFLPALMAAFANGNRRNFLVGFAATNLGYALYLSKVAGHFGFGHLFLWWTASGWLLTYLLSRRPRLGVAVASPLHMADAADSL
jgi:hypothetical protein